MTEDLLKKACEAKSPEELLRIAHENGMTDFNEENAKAYFDMLNQHGEISEEELENAAGGCGGQGLSINCYCPFQWNGDVTFWTCSKCGKQLSKSSVIACCSNSVRFGNNEHAASIDCENCHWSSPGKYSFQYICHHHLKNGTEVKKSICAVIK